MYFQLCDKTQDIAQMKIKFPPWDNVYENQFSHQMILLPHKCTVLTQAR